MVMHNKIERIAQYVARETRRTPLGLTPLIRIRDHLTKKQRKAVVERAQEILGPSFNVLRVLPPGMTEDTVPEDLLGDTDSA